MGVTGSTTGRAGRLGAVALAAAALVVALVPVGAASAGVSAPEVTITPATGLTDHQEVTVSGTGFPGSVELTVLQCETGATTFEQCDNSWVYWADVDAGGSFSTTVALRQTIAVQGGPLDCSVAGACVIGAGVMPNWSPFATVPLEVASFAPSTLPAVAAPDCPSPYVPYGYFRGAVDVPEFVPGLNGTLVPYADTDATVDIRQDGDVLLLTVVLDGVTRELTTGGLTFGGDYNRTPGPSDTPFGAVGILYADDGAVYVTLAQNNSGDYTRFGWRFDDPCLLKAIPAVGVSPAFTG